MFQPLQQSSKSHGFSNDTQPTASYSAISHIRLKAPINVVNSSIYSCFPRFLHTWAFHACEAVSITSTCPLYDSTLPHLRGSILLGHSSPPTVTLHWQSQWNPPTSRKSAHAHNSGPLSVAQTLHTWKGTLGTSQRSPALVKQNKSGSHGVGLLKQCGRTLMIAHSNR